ncbi:MAG: Uma2 family endonuclease [Acidobacteriota bacterium]
MPGPVLSEQAKLTYEDYALFPEDGKRHEIIDGVHYMSPAPTIRHQRIVKRLVVEIELYLRANPGGEVHVSPTDVVLSNVDVVQPDLLFVSSARAAVTTEKNIQGAPDLAVEVLSEKTRRVDEVTKRRRYEQFGVQEYWVVDPELESVRLYRMQEGRFERAADLTIERQDILSTPLLPGLVIPLSKIFA